MQSTRIRRRRDAVARRRPSPLGAGVHCIAFPHRRCCIRTLTSTGAPPGIIFSIATATIAATRVALLPVRVPHWQLLRIPHRHHLLAMTIHTST